MVGFALKTDDDRVKRHLKEKQSISTQRRQKLHTLVNSLYLPNLDELPKRADGSARHPDLALLTGAECKHCALRSTSHDILSCLVAMRRKQVQAVRNMETPLRELIDAHYRRYPQWKNCYDPDIRELNYRLEKLVQCGEDNG
jgi:hypothetical protein